MIILIIGTTPTFNLKISGKEELDLTEAENIYFTIRQGSIKMTKSNEDITVIDEHNV